ncbi:MAG: serine hydrolase [Armatimonadota bacterium]|nr:serine hydrolase [Armatimonadota bacterium]MDR7544682.1 serine hydrolase [Armatimonadota bacterium]
MALEAAREPIEALIRSAPGTVGLVIKDLRRGVTLEWAPHERFPAASVIKIAVLIEALRQAAEGSLRLDERVTVRAEDKVGGFGILKDLESVGELSLRDLLTLMIVISDNTAANLCIDRVGMTRVNAGLAALGLRETVLQRKMMDTAARERGLDNFTTPAETAYLLERLVRREILTAELCDLALDVLRRQQVRDRIPLLLPPGMSVAHKTGELPGIRHDVGVVFTDAGPLVIAALTKDFATPLGQGLIGGEAAALIAQVSRSAYDAVMAA